MRGNNREPGETQVWTKWLIFPSPVRGRSPLQGRRELPTPLMEVAVRKQKSNVLPLPDSKFEERVVNTCYL